MVDISREDVAGLIRDGYTDNVFASASEGSAVLNAFTTVSMGTKTNTLPVAATLPEAQFVSESGTKPTAEITWANKNLVAEEIAVIIPVHENVVADATVDILAEIAEKGGAAIGRAFDKAVLFGTNKPATWTSNSLLEAAVASGNVFAEGTGADDLYGSFLQAAGAVAEEGDPTDVFTSRGLAYRMANLRTTDGGLVLSSDGASLAGLDRHTVIGKAWERDSATGIVVDASKIVIGVRQDLTVKFLDQATVGGINLAERDMIALRFVARYAYVLADNAAVAAVTPAAAGE